MSLIKRAEIEKYILTKLGYPTVAVELAPENLASAIEEAVDEYQSSGAVERGYSQIPANPASNEFDIPPGVGTIVGVTYSMPFQLMAGAAQDIFAFSAFTPMGPSISNYMHGAANLALFYEYSQNRSRVMGNEITWKVIDNKLYVFPYPKTADSILIEYTKNTYDDESGDKIISISNNWGINWIKKYSLAVAKGMLGQVRGKFTNISAGPGESQTLNGAELISESKEEMTALKDDLLSHSTSAQFFVG